MKFAGGEGADTLHAQLALGRYGTIDVLWQSRRSASSSAHSKQRAGDRRRTERQPPLKNSALFFV